MSISSLLNPLKIGKDRLLGRKVQRMKKILEYIAMGIYFSKKKTCGNERSSTVDMSLFGCHVTEEWMRRGHHGSREMYFIFSISIQHLPSTIPWSLVDSHLHVQRLQCWSSPWSATLLADTTSSNVKRSKKSGMGEVCPQGYVSGGKEKKSTGVSQPTTQGSNQFFEKSSKQLFD